MNRAFVLVVILVLDWVAVFEDEEESVYGPNARPQGRGGFS